MKYLIALTVAGICGLLCIPSAEADCQAIRQRVIVHHAAHQVVAVKQAVIAPIAVATFAAYPVHVPTYSVGYDPHGGEIQELRKTVKELTQALKGMQNGVTPQQTAQPAPDDIKARAIQLVSAKCGSCHTGATPSGKFVIFTEPGKMNTGLNILDLVEMEKQSKDGRMPKGQPSLTDPEFQLLEQWVELERQAVRKSVKAQGNP